MAYNTPGVYVKEISIFPPSVAEVETAVPAFIGYTEKAALKGVDLTNVPTRISSLLDYKEYFGEGRTPESIDVALDSNQNPSSVTITPRYYMYDSLRLFFDNGGGDAYIVSVGPYHSGGATDPDDFKNGLDALKKYDEPTIILFPDAALLDKRTDLYALQASALKQCEDLMDRVSVFDIPRADTDNDHATEVGGFRSGVGTKGLKYGAAYTPFIQTTYGPDFDFEQVLINGSDNIAAYLSVNGSGDVQTAAAELVDATTDRTTISGFIDGHFETAPDFTNVQGSLSALQDIVMAGFGLSSSMLTFQADFESFAENTLKPIHQALLQNQVDYNAIFGTSPLSIITEDADHPLDTSIDPSASSIYSGLDETSPDATAAADAVSLSTFETFYSDLTAAFDSFLEEIVNGIENRDLDLMSSSTVYSAIVDAIDKEGSIIPPSGAVAGIYTYVDGTRGVWKAPANVSLSSVVGPTIIIDDHDQESLNIDATSGKSINAIRAFTGKGTLVWGARTLAGNDNEWRYVPVRRFFNMVEESVKKATAWAVFEPNDSGTWTKVKTMIDNFLIQQWRAGALAGAKPDEAFFVKVGLGLTMTQQDILEGRLIVEIGMAVVRPAEFIILKFSHKLQES